MVRLARTHLRFGTCERRQSLREPQALEHLLRHVVRVYYPQIAATLRRWNLPEPPVRSTIERICPPSSSATTGSPCMTGWTRADPATAHDLSARRYSVHRWALSEFIDR